MSHALPALLLGVCTILGLVLVPLGLPGLWLMVAGVVGYGWLTDFRSVGVATIAVVLGAFLGSFAGAALFEYSLSRTPETAVRAGWGALVGRATAAAAKIALGVVIAVLGVFAALRG